MQFFRFTILILVASNVAGENICSISLNDDLPAQKSFVFVDPSKHNEIVYPSANKPAVIELSVKSKDGFIVHCERGYPGKIKVGNQTWSNNALNIFCHKGKKIYIGKSRSKSFDIQTLSCTNEIEMKQRPIPPTVPDRQCFEVGHDLNMRSIKVLGVCFAANYLYWHAEATIQPSINRRNRPKRMHVVKDMVYHYFQTDLENKTQLKIWSANYQFRRVAEFLGNYHLAKQYINSTYPFYLGPGQLIQADLLMYEHEQKATYMMSNIVPMWVSIIDNNWKLIARLGRRFASEHNTQVKVTSGTMDILRLVNYDNVYKSFHFTCSEMDPWYVMVPKFIYSIYTAVKPVKKVKRLVFVVYNNIYPEYLNDQNIHVCSPLEWCWEHYPEFLDFKKGYTYCCDYEDLIRII